MLPTLNVLLIGIKELTTKAFGETVVIHKCSKTIIDDQEVAIWITLFMEDMRPKEMVLDVYVFGMDIESLKYCK